MREFLAVKLHYALVACVTTLHASVWVDGYIHGKNLNGACSFCCNLIWLRNKQSCILFLASIKFYSDRGALFASSMMLKLLVSSLAQQLLFSISILQYASYIMLHSASFCAYFFFALCITYYCIKIPSSYHFRFYVNSAFAKCCVYLFILFIPYSRP